MTKVHKLSEVTISSNLEDVGAWVYELGDSSVGINAGWAHDCEAMSLPELVWAETVLNEETDTFHQWVTVEKFVCDCSAVLVSVEHGSEYLPYYGEDEKEA